MTTIKDIMSELEQRVINNIPISPGSWVEAALRVNALKGDLDNEIVLLESMMADREATLVAEGQPATKAKVLARQSVDYKQLLTLRAYANRIDEFIRLAKRRAVVNEM